MHFGKDTFLFAFLFAVNGGILFALWHFEILNFPFFLDYRYEMQAVAGIALVLSIAETLLINKIKGN